MDFVHSFASEFNYRPGSSNMRHTGCLTCKRRHKKCDQKRPQCDNCTRLNLVCQQPDLFRASKLSRSHPKKRSHVQSQPLNRESSEFVAPPGQNSTPITEHNDDTALTSPTFDDDTSRLFMDIFEWIRPPPATPFSPIEEYLMEHYVERLSSILINIDGPINSLRSISVPRMVTSPMLTDALYATSARHLFICEGKAEYRTASFKYYNKASCTLRDLIGGLGSDVSVEQREIMLLTSVFLCKYEIISGEVKNWRLHLRGLHKMFRICQKNGVKISEEMVSYIQSFVAYHWYIAGITRTERVSASSEDTDSDEEIESELVLSDHIDPYMGFSGKFISVLNSVAQIIMLDFTQGFDMDTIMQTAMKTIQIIKPDPRQSALHNLPSGMTPEMSTYLGDIASAYRHALMVYLHIVLERLIQTHGTDAKTLQFLLMRSLIPCTKEGAIRVCLEDILRVPEHTSAAVGSTPLLFIIASETNDQAEFQRAFDLLMRLWTRTCLGNTGVALDFLHQIQEADFPDWRQVLKLRKWDLIIS